jgi:uncharacterized damage-inducible protein DinB
MNTNIELLKYMLDDIRRVTLSGIKGLTKEQLFQPPVEGEFPIGAYLMHLAEADLFWLSIASGKEQPEDLKKRVYADCWFDSLKEKYNPPKEAPEINEYIDVLSEVREILHKYLTTLEDKELEEKISLSWRKGAEVTKKWIIYHLIEHEAHTRGQIFLLIRLAGFKKKGENN